MAQSTIIAPGNTAAVSAAVTVLAGEDVVVGLYSDAPAAMPVHVQCAVEQLTPGVGNAIDYLSGSRRSIKLPGPGTYRVMRPSFEGASIGVFLERLGAPGYDAGDEMIKVKSVQKKFRDSFTGDAVKADKWDVVLGAGGIVSVAGGALTMGSGGVANAETYLLSREVFSVPFRVSIGLTLSQRIANQQFFAEAVSVDAETMQPDGQHCVALVFEGTSATQAKYRVQNGGLAPLDSGAVTFPTTATGSVYEIEPFADEAWFHGGVLDSTNARSNSYRRHQQIPDPNALYKIRLRWLNGATAPASSTNAVVQYLAVQDYAELTAEITAGRGQSVAGQAVGVQVAGGGVSITGTVTPNPTGGTSGSGYSTAGQLISAATTNATSVKTSGANVGMLCAFNSNAGLRYLKIYNKASAPTVGTDTPVHTIPLKSGELTAVPIPAMGLRLSTGFALAITAGQAVNDTAAVAAGDVVVNWEYV